MSATASAADSGPERNEKLVTIQVEREFDVLNKNWEERVYVKMFVAARTSGLLAAMPAREWHTLCTMATFMDKDGRCYPSQDEIARSLKIDPATANRRVQALAKFRFEGKPVLLVEKQTQHTAKGIRFASNQYTIMPVTKLRIFDRNGETARDDEKSPV